MRGFDALKTPLQAYFGYHSRYTPPARWITFSGVPSPLTNFPALVKASGWQNIANGYDVHFQDSSGTELAFELSWYDDSTKSGAWWVLIPTLTSGTAIKVLYGDASISTDQSSPETVWAGYDYVYHFTDSANLKSSVGDFSAVQAGTLNFDVFEIVDSDLTGKALKMQMFRGQSSSRARLKLTETSFNINTGTLSIIASSTRIPKDRDTQLQTGWNSYGIVLTGGYFYAKGGGLAFTFNQSLTDLCCYGGSTTTGSVAVVVNGASQDVSGASSTGWIRNDEPLMLNMTGHSTTYPTELIMHEFRFSKTVNKSEDWLLYEQLNMIQHSNYTTYSDETAA